MSLELLYFSNEIDFTKIQGCCTWIDFSDKNTITKRAGTDYIYQANDKSKFANHLQQSVEANQPILNASGYATFDGATSWMAFLKFTEQIGLKNSDFEIFFKMRTAINTSNVMFLLSSQVVQYWEIHLNANAVDGVRFINTSGSDFVDKTGVATADTNIHIINARVNSDTGYVAVDGSDGAVPRTGYRKDLDYGLFVGKRAPHSSFYFQGDIYQIVIFNRTLTTAERTYIVNNL